MGIKTVQTLTGFQEVDPVANSKLQIGRVILPTPISSEFIIPNSVNASSYSSIPINLSNMVIQADTNLTNQTSIYDNNDTTYAYDTNSTSTNLVIITWDTGSIQTYSVYFKHSTIDTRTTSYLEYSNDNTNYTTLSSVNNNTVSNTIIATFRYIRWRVTGSTTGFIQYARLYTLNIAQQNIPSNTIDNNTSTYWQPNTTNSGEWISFDTGQIQIISGCNIYFLNNTAYIPQNFTIQTSTDNSTWQNQVNITSKPSGGQWLLYTWSATYVRYIRIYLNIQGTLGTQLAEFQYYSPITSRVASLHGHGSGPTDIGLHGIGKTLKNALSDKHEKIKAKDPDLGELLEHILNQL